MKIPKILIEESDEVEEQEGLTPEDATESQTETKPAVVVPNIQESPRSHVEEVNEEESEKENVEQIHNSPISNAVKLEENAEQGNNNVESMISANFVETEEAPCSNVDLVEEREDNVEDNEKKDILKQDLHVPIVYAEEESDIETTSDIGNVSELYETANDTEYEKQLSMQVERDLGTSMESITTKDDDERLRILGRRYEVNSSSRESSMPVSDYDFQCRIDSIRNDRRPTLRKQYMLVDSDDDDDTHSLRPVHDDDYFASTESLGIGVSRESLDKTFSQLDLVCGEAIPERDENALSRSGSRDDTFAQTENNETGVKSLEHPENPNIFTEYSDTAYSESLSSEPEDLEEVVAETAKNIKQEVDNLSLVWTEGESVENRKISNDLKTLKDTKPEVPNQIIHGEPNGELQAQPKEESFVEESKRPLETTKDFVNSSIDSEKANTTEAKNDDLQKVKQHNKEVSSTKENTLKEGERDLNVIEDISEKQVKTSQESDKHPSYVQAEVEPPNKQIHEAFDNVTTESRKKDGTSDRLSNEDEPVECIEEDAIVPQTQTPKNAAPKFVDVPPDANLQQQSDEINILANIDMDETKYRTPMDDFLMSNSKITDNRKRTRPVILSASSDITIKEGQCLVMEWEITGLLRYVSYFEYLIN
jgi:hypothetical protein